MRLTLRTLLAWLDDKLEPAEVRQIGKQVAESPYAQELIDRTYRVTRQRRLLVPPAAGPDATDPNLVAAYLDNELSPDEVTEYEKKCLTSDVNLAEVASAHQILSLIGQRAKVPPEARHRMYRLIKGREASNNRSARDFPSTPAPPVTPEIAPWSAPPAPRRTVVERLGILAIVAGLLVVVTWTTISSLTPERNREPARVGISGESQPARVLVAQVDPNVEGTRPGEPANEVAKPNPTGDAAGKDAKSADVAKTEAVATPAEPASGPVKLVKGEGIALGWSAEKGEWSRLADATAIKDGTRVLNLSPFWTTLQAGAVQVVLVADTETTVAGGDRRACVKLGFDHGRAILKGGTPGSPYLVNVAGSALAITNAPGTAIGIERSWTRAVALTGDGVSPLVVHVPEGEATLQVGDAKETVKGPAAVELTEKGVLKPVAKPVVPPWVNESGPSPSEKQLGERYLKFFSPSGSVLRDLVQAVDGDDADVRRLAVRGLGSVGDAEMIVPVLNNAMTDPSTRRAAADVLRGMLARGGATAKALRAELTKVFGQEWAEATEKLLNGFTPEEGRNEATYVGLVRLLAAPELGTRELAVQALMALTGRDNLEYDPIKPEGRGLKAWQDLLYKKELMKAAPPAGNGR